MVEIIRTNNIEINVLMNKDFFLFFLNSTQLNQMPKFR